MILNARQIAILKHLYKIAAEDAKNNIIPGKFRLLDELAKSLKCSLRVIYIDIDRLAKNDIIDLIYSDNPKIFNKTFRLRRSDVLYELLLPTIKNCEGILLDVYFMTGATCVLDTIKFE